MNDIYRKRMTLKITNTTHVYEVLHAMSDYYNKKGRKVNVICDFNPYTTI
jgi:primosomal protein N' (replication factor Y)